MNDNGIISTQAKLICSVYYNSYLRYTFYLLRDECNSLRQRHWSTVGPRVCLSAVSY